MDGKCRVAWIDDVCGGEGGMCARNGYYSCDGNGHAPRGLGRFANGLERGAGSRHRAA